jgi:Ca2+-binding RTX toxin-like protein
MSIQRTSSPRDEPVGRQTLVAFAAAFTVVVLLLAIAPGRVAAASTVGAAVVRGTLIVTGTPAANRIALRLSRTLPKRLQVDFGDNGTTDRSFTLASFAAIDVEAGGGNDRIRIDNRNGSFTKAKPTRLNGGSGNDTLIGGDGSETLIGGDGNDVVDGNGGADQVSLGNGNDTLDWDAGDGSDVVRGAAGVDTLVVTGSATDEFLGFTTRFGRVTFTRALRDPFDAGNASVDLDGIDAIRVRPRGGDDEVHVGDLTGSDVASVDVDLAAAPGGSFTDAQADTVAVIGTVGNDTITVAAGTNDVEVRGLAAAVRVRGADADLDTLAITTLDGADAVTVAPAVLDLIQVSSGP